MTRINVNGSDMRTLYLFKVDLPPEAVERFTQMAGTGEWPLKYALGAEKLREGFVETVALDDLTPMSLSQYLAEAYDVRADALKGDRTRLDALEGHVVILPPQAFDGTSQTLNVASPLVWLGSYGEEEPTARGIKVTTASAKGSAGGGAPAGLGKGSSTLLKLILGALGLVILLALYLGFGR